MQYKTLTQNRVQATPTYIHALTSKTLIVSYSDKIYEIYNGTDTYVISNDIAPAVCGINVGEDQCLFGLDNGNGVFIRVKEGQFEFFIQKWRAKNYQFAISMTILCRINEKQFCAVNEDGTIIIIEQKEDTEYNIVTKFNLKIKIGACHIDHKLAIFTSGNSIIGLNILNLQEASDYESDKLKKISESQLFLFGLTGAAYADYWQSQCQIIGQIFYIVVEEQYMYLTTDKGYFYSLKINYPIIGFDIQKVLDTGFNRPIQLNRINETLIHLAFQGSQLLMYDTKTKVISKLLQIKQDKQLVGSRIEEKDNSLLIFLVYRQKPSNYQELNPPKFSDAHAKLLQLIYKN